MKNVKDTSKTLPKVRGTGPKLKRVDRAKVAEALGAEPGPRPKVRPRPGQESKIRRTSEDVTDLTDRRFQKNLVEPLKEALGPDFGEEAIVSGLTEAAERHKAYEAFDAARAKDMRKRGLNPATCYCFPCVYHLENQTKPPEDAVGEGEGTQAVLHPTAPKCSKGSQWAARCLFHMLDPPPNSLNYDGPIPTHQKALDILVVEGLLKSENDSYLWEDPQTGKALSQQARGKTLLPLTQNELRLIVRDALMRIVRANAEHGGGRILDEDDIDIAARNVAVSAEAVCGIYPNIRLRMC